MDTFDKCGLNQQAPDTRPLAGRDSQASDVFPIVGRIDLQGLAISPLGMGVFNAVDITRFELATVEIVDKCKKSS